MTVLSKKTQSAIADELRRQHQILEAECEKIVEAARTCDWRECDVIWSDFERLLKQHMSFEEKKLFAAYARHARGGAAEVEALEAEHDEILKLAEAVGNDLEMHHTQANVETLIAQLKKHAERENKLFYPWLEAHGDKEPASLHTT